MANALNITQGQRKQWLKSRDRNHQEGIFGGGGKIWESLKALLLLLESSAGWRVKLLLLLESCCCLKALLEGEAPLCPPSSSFHPMLHTLLLPRVVGTGWWVVFHSGGVEMSGLSC